MTSLSQHWSHREDPTYPPWPETRAEINPSLLVSWWCTLFACVIIFIRLGGRWVRTERLFSEDKVMALAIFPLIGRMVLVHYILKFGTNNVYTANLTPEDISHRVTGSKLVLPARLLYAMFLWIAKWTIADFLHRIYSQMWTKKQDLALQGIKWFLGLTYLGVLISTLAECQPFPAYWQVVPDPGASCRDSYSQLITMGVLDSVTDVLLVVFPLPIIFSSNMKLDRKISLSLLFSMSLILVGITIYRVQSTIEHHYSQRFRSLLASFEILAATGVSNAIVLGSFLRDRGLKKNKFKQGSTGQESVLDRPNNVLVSTRSHPAAARSTSSRNAHHVRGLHSWGSDVDLVSELGIRLGPEFHAEKQPRLAQPAPVAMPMVPLGRDGKPVSRDWAAGRDKGTDGSINLQNANLDSEDEDFGYDSDPPSPKTPFTPKIDFFDVGGLLNGPGSPNPTSPTRTRGRRRRQSSVSFAPLPSSSSNVPLISGAHNDGGNRDVSPTTPARRQLPMERFGIGSGAPHPGGLSAFHFPFQHRRLGSDDPKASFNNFSFPKRLSSVLKNETSAEQSSPTDPSTDDQAGSKIVQKKKSRNFSKKD